LRTRRSRTRQNEPDFEFEQSPLGPPVVCHIAFRRSGHCRTVSKNIVAAEQHPVAGLIKATVAGFMARGVKHLQLATAERDPIVVVVLKIFATEITRTGAMNAELGAAAFSQRQGTVAVVAMNMG